MSDKSKGVYEKFTVVRNDGKSEPGQKHHDCCYFVLDLTHDEFAAQALYAYAKACKLKFPMLASDVEMLARGVPLPRVIAIGELAQRYADSKEGECGQ